MGLEHYQAGFKPLLFGIILALTLILFVKETGPAARQADQSPGPPAPKQRAAGIGAA